MEGRRFSILLLCISSTCTLGRFSTALPCPGERQQGLFLFKFYNHLSLHGWGGGGAAALFVCVRRKENEKGKIYINEQATLSLSTLPRLLTLTSICIFVHKIILHLFFSQTPLHYSFFSLEKTLLLTTAPRPQS